MCCPSFKTLGESDVITCVWRNKSSRDLVRVQSAKTWYEFNRIKLFLQKIISWLALSFSCNRMRLSHINFAWIILCKFHAFNCAIFSNTNLVEKIILPQTLDRFGAVIYGNFLWWIGWIRSTVMVERECIRLISIRSQISSFCGCHWVKLFRTNSASYTAKSVEGGGGRWLRNRRQNVRKFLFLPFPKIFVKI